MHSDLGARRVVFVLESLELGGAERQVLLLSDHLVHHCGADVQIWGFRDPGRVTELCNERDIAWRHLALRRPQGRGAWLGSVLTLASELRRAMAEIVLPYGTFPNILCGLAWRLGGARLCAWNQRDEGRHLSGRVVEHWAVRFTPRFISNSRHGAEFLARKFRISRDKVSVIYNGVALAQPESSRETWRSRLGLSQEDFAACMVANLHRFKDHMTLLRAWRLVTDRLSDYGVDATLLLAGRFGDTTESLKALAYDLQLGSSVRFLGGIDDVSGILQACDLAVFSSATEGCPNGVLESMASGLAVVGTDIPGIREALGEGYGYYVPPGDAEALADRIVHLARHPETRHVVGRANYKRIDAMFGPRRMCETTAAQLNSWLD